MRRFAIFVATRRAVSGCLREIGDDVQSVLEAAIRRDLQLAENRLRLLVVELVHIDEAVRAPHFAAYVDRPAREAACNIDDVFESEVRFDAYGVELEELSSPVLVEAELPPPDSDSFRSTYIVVEVEEHRRALRDRDEHVLEAAEDVRPNRVSLILGDAPARQAIAAVHIEVVEPEVGHHRFELSAAQDGAQDLGLSELAKGLLGAPDRSFVGVVVGTEFGPEHVERLEPSQRSVELGVGNRLGVELLLDVGLGAQLLEPAPGPLVRSVAGP